MCPLLARNGEWPIGFSCNRVSDYGNALCSDISIKRPSLTHGLVNVREETRGAAATAAPSNTRAMGFSSTVPADGMTSTMSNEVSCRVGSALCISSGVLDAVTLEKGLFGWWGTRALGAPPTNPVKLRVGRSVRETSAADGRFRSGWDWAGRTLRACTGGWLTRATTHGHTRRAGPGTSAHGGGRATAVGWNGSRWPVNCFDTNVAEADTAPFWPRAVGCSSAAATHRVRVCCRAGCR